MSHIISLLGGSGSCQIVANMTRLGQTVHVRPEIGWQPARFGQPQREVQEFWKRELEDGGYEMLSIDGYSKPTSEWLTFRRRTSCAFEPQLKQPLFDNMVNYVRWCQANGVSVISEHLAEFSVFSSAGIKDVVFVFRHPLKAYLAFAERHPDIIDQLGGVSGARAIAGFGLQWDLQAREYLACRNAKLNPVRVLFEIIATTCPIYLQPLFEGWHGKSEHPCKLPEQAIELLRLWVDKPMKWIYGSKNYGWRH